MNSIRFYANNATKAYAEKYATIATGDSVSDYGNNSNGKISLYKIFDKYGVDTQKSNILLIISQNYCTR